MTGDELTPRGSARQLLAKLPRADITTWHNPDPLGHNGWISDPDSTLDHVENWLRDH